MANPRTQTVLLAFLSIGLLSKDQPPIFKCEVAITEGSIVIHYGLGVHAAALDPNQLTTVGKGLLAFECIYVTTVALTKISLLLMYCRIPYPKYANLLLDPWYSIDLLVYLYYRGLYLPMYTNHQSMEPNYCRLLYQS